MYNSAKNQWASGMINVTGKTYQCGYCNAKVAPSYGYSANEKLTGSTSYLYICPNCTHVTYLSTFTGQIPGNVFGNQIEQIPDKNIENLYNEVRRCFSIGAFTASSMIARKILMNVAVTNGAKENLSFVAYVDYLEANGWVPPNGKKWVDQIRKKGNEANHEINLIGEEDTKQIIKFLEMLLKFMFEMSTPD